MTEDELVIDTEDKLLGYRWVFPTTPFGLYIRQAFTSHEERLHFDRYMDAHHRFLLVTDVAVRFFWEVYRRTLSEEDFKRARSVQEEQYAWTGVESNWGLWEP